MSALGVTPVELEDLQTAANYQLAKSNERVVVATRVLHRLLQQFQSMLHTLEDFAQMRPCAVCGSVGGCLCPGRYKEHAAAVRAFVEDIANEYSILCGKQAAYDALKYTLPLFAQKDPRESTHTEFCDLQCQFLTSNDKKQPVCGITFQVLETATNSFTESGPMRCERCKEILRLRETVEEEKRIACSAATGIYV